MAKAKKTAKKSAKKSLKKVRVGMIGAGGMANSVHYPSLASFDDVEFAGICDIDPERLKTTADKYGIAKRYDDYRKMVEEVNPDALYIIGSPPMMYHIWTWALSEGRHVYIEKPNGISLHQARSLATMADRNNCLTQVSFQRRSCPMVVMLRDKILKRGPVVHAVSRFFKFNPGDNFGDQDRLVSDGIHAVDTLRWMCGGEVLDVHSVCKRVGSDDLNFFNIFVEFDNGSTGNILLNWASGRRIFSVGMHGIGIAAEAEHEGKGYLYADGDYQGIEYDTKEVAKSSQNFVFGGFQAKNRNFIDCIKTGKQPESNFADALKTMELCEIVLGQAAMDGA